MCLEHRFRLGKCTDSPRTKQTPNSPPPQMLLCRVMPPFFHNMAMNKFQLKVLSNRDVSMGGGEEVLSSKSANIHAPEIHHASLTF